jgi:hypothetical protein
MCERMDDVSRVISLEEVPMEHRQIVFMNNDIFLDK